jgi:hypothetical protein
VLTGDPAAENSLQRPTIIVPREEPIAQLATDHVEKLGPHSLTILRLPGGAGTGAAAPSR